MKRIFSLLLSLVLLSVMQLWAQSTMMVTKTDGTKIEIRVAEIQDITFPDDDRTIVELSYRGYWLHPEQWVKLSALCMSPTGEEIHPVVKWRSTDEAVCTVDQKGVVTGVAEGTCQVVAEANGTQEALTIHVTQQTMLDIQIEQVGNLSCTYKVVPADASLRYYHDYRIMHGDYSVDNLTPHGSMEQNLYHFVLDWWAFCGDLYGMPWEDFMNDSGLSSGEVHESLDKLYAGEEYVLYAFAVDEDGALASPVEARKFTTGSPEQSDITFQVTIDDIRPSEVIFSVVPSNDDKYFVNVQRASYVEWFVEHDCLGDMVTSLTSEISPTVYPEAYCQGPVTRSTDNFLASLRKDSDYYVIVFGYDEGQTSPVSLTKFHTQR